VGNISMFPNPFCSHFSGT